MTRKLPNEEHAGSFGLSHDEFFNEVICIIQEKLSRLSRIIVGVAGPPAVGKTTFAKSLVTALNAQKADVAALVPMDGFHLDNAVLDAAGLLHRKGAPETFDVEGFHSLLRRIRDGEHDQFAPTFDRTRDIAIAGAQKVAVETQIIIVEGNYLLLDRDHWRNITAVFDHSIFVEAPLETLERRLVQRWRDNGYDEEGAFNRAQSNDIPNAELVVSRSVHADQRFYQSSDP